MTRPLDAIFFDIDDTLFSTSEFADKARRAAVDAMIRSGLQASREECLRELQEVLVEFSSNYGNHFDKVIERLPAAASAAVNRAVLVAAGVVAYHDTKWRELRIYDDAFETLQWLSGTQLLRGIVSAGITIKQAEKLIRLGILPFLTPGAIFFSDEVGFSKSNPKLYRRVRERLGLLAARCMYVGDNPANDIDPCNREGWITVRCRRSGRHAQETGATQPAYEVRDLRELQVVLRSDFGLT